MTTKLTVQKRTEDTNAVRAAGKLPAVVYGPKQESIAIECDALEFEKLFATAGESTIINLEGLDEELEVLVHDVAFHAEKGGYLHVDFYAIERGKELTTHVAIHFIGEAPVEKGGATVNKSLHEVEVTCRPSALPSEFVVDLTQFTDDSIIVTVADLKVPAGVTIDTEPETPIASVSAARKAEPETTDETNEVDMDVVEVEGKGKADDADGDDEESE